MAGTRGIPLQTVQDDTSGSIEIRLGFLKQGPVHTLCLIHIHMALIWPFQGLPCASDAAQEHSLVSISTSDFECRNCVHTQKWMHICFGGTKRKGF